MTLPTDRDERNALPIWDGCFAYFPDCWAEIAKVSVLGNKQHALGDKLRFARDVSTDHLNKVMRHCLDHEAGNVFDDGGKTRHLAKAAWRILAKLQVSIEEDRAVKAFLDSREPVIDSADGHRTDQKGCDAPGSRQAPGVPHNPSGHCEGSSQGTTWG